MPAKKKTHPIGNLEDCLWWPTKLRDGLTMEWLCDTLEIAKRRIEKLETENPTMGKQLLPVQPPSGFNTQIDQCSDFGRGQFAGYAQGKIDANALAQQAIKCEYYNLREAYNKCQDGHIASQLEGIKIALEAIGGRIE